jgi:hypothetical protein
VEAFAISMTSLSASLTPSSESDKAPDEQNNQEWQFPPPGKHIGTVPLAMIIFYSVAGGPFGLEGSVRTAGFLFSIIGFMVIPILYAVPEALMTAELGSAFQEASGGVAWAEEAFGSAVGWIAGKNSLLEGVADSTCIRFDFCAWFLCF